ncbi:THAP domain-containing protein 2-like isoform X3 [Stegodyphus dumicola]|uniref:THAP domain-containing protein 2-like isoform X3 n=1 Tax=Stegodyphus dumicola TaxID=202533 RepID=UPI0015B1827B|nr:THAP domain-containing protein 2-like isoform X3 [Stegodyphus dumicola]
MKRGNDHTFCCVPGCNSRAQKEPHLSFHRFPASRCLRQDDDAIRRRAKWICALRKKNVTDFMKVCSKHFQKTDYILPDSATKRPHLKRTAVPSLNLPTDNEQSISKIRKSTDQRHGFWPSYQI